MSKFVKELSEEVEDLEKKIEEKKVSLYIQNFPRKRYKCIAQRAPPVIISDAS